MEEGDWEDTHILLVYEVNVDALAIRLQDAKIRGAWEIANDPISNPGNRIIPVKKGQILRGLINHWVGSSRFWKYMVALFNSLLGFADGTNTWVRCEGDQTWIDVWNLMKFLLRCSQGDIIWNALFNGSLLDLMPLPRRLSFPAPDFQIIWATGDALLGRYAAINWSTDEYIVDDSEGFLADINPKSRRIIISDVEKLASTSIIAMRGEREKVVLLGTDNRNVLAWTPNGFAKKGIALTLNQETPTWIEKKAAGHRKLPLTEWSQFQCRLDEQN